MLLRPVRCFGLAAVLAFVSVTFGCSSDPVMSGTGGTGGATGTGGGTGGSGGGTFLCKGLMCMRGQEACTVTSHMSQDDMGQCTSLPLPCLDPGADCSCFIDLMGCVCQKQPTGDFAIFCDVMN